MTEHPVDEFKRLVAETVRASKARKRRASLKVRLRARFWATWGRVRGWWLKTILRRKPEPCTSRLVVRQSDTYSIRIYWVDKDGKEVGMPAFKAGEAIKVDENGRVIR